jgi:hypothetical protein
MRSLNLTNESRLEIRPNLNDKAISSHNSEIRHLYKYLFHIFIADNFNALSFRKFKDAVPNKIKIK